MKLNGKHWLFAQLFVNIVKGRQKKGQRVGWRERELLIMIIYHLFRQECRFFVREFTITVKLPSALVMAGAADNILCFSRRSVKLVTYATTTTPLRLWNGGKWFCKGKRIAITVVYLRPRADEKLRKKSGNCKIPNAAFFILLILFPILNKVIY